MVFTTHTPVPAGHDRFDAGLVEEHIGPLARSARAFAGKPAGTGSRESQQLRRTVLHDGPGAAALAPRQRRLGAARRSLARHVDRPVPRQAGRRSSHRTHHQRRARSVLAGSADVPPLRPPSRAPTGTSAAAKPKIWVGIENVDDGELWETHLNLKSQLIEFVRRRGRGSGRAPRRIARRTCSAWSASSAPML